MIPKIIHHVWPGDDAFRPELHAWRKTWLDHHPDWTLMFWRLTYPTGQPIEYPGLGELLARQDLTVVVKSDVLRWYPLMVFGGIYVDTDFECHAPLDALLEGGAFCGVEMNRTTLSPSLVGATRAHPLVRAMLDASIAMVAKWSDTAERVKELNARPQDLTGPRLFDAVAKGAVDPKLPIEVPAPLYTGPEKIVVHGFEDFDWLELDHGEHARPKYARHHWTGCRMPWGWSVRQKNGDPNFGVAAPLVVPTRTPAIPPPPIPSEFAATIAPAADTDKPPAPPPEVHPDAVAAAERVPVANIPGAVHTEAPGRIKSYGDGAFDRPPQFKPMVPPAALPPNPSPLHPQVAVPASHETQARQIGNGHIHAPTPAPAAAVAAAVAAASGPIPGYEAFWDWYKPGEGGSGPGSSAAYTERFRAWLQAFMREQNVKSVLDFGCGDWSWAKHVDWTGIDYLGMEIIPDVVRGLQMQFARPQTETQSRIAFEIIDPRKFELPANYAVDLVICKDVLQHLPSNEVMMLVAKLSRAARHCFWINDRHGQVYDNRDIKVRGAYRSLDLSAPPFSVRGDHVFEFGHRPDKKGVFWQKGMLYTG